MDYQDIKYQNLSDDELKEVWKSLIDEAKQLKLDISHYIEGGRKVKKDDIKSRYRMQKYRVQFIAKYLKHNNDDARANDPLFSNFKSSIEEADTHGFAAQKGAEINQKLHASIEETYYRLSKYFR